MGSAKPHDEGGKGGALGEQGDVASDPMTLACLPSTLGDDATGATGRTPAEGGTMVRITAGSRLVLHTDGREVSVRALADVELSGAWSVPVLAPLRALVDGDGVLEVTTPGGLLQIPAHLSFDDGVLSLRPGTSAEPALHQRRGDVRGRLLLPLRATPADAAAHRVFADAVVEGVTLDVSAGGLAVDVHPRSGRTPHGSRLYVELHLPQDRVVPSVVTVVDLADRRLHGRFVDIAPVDREHLVGLIFSQQRRDLAGRLRTRR